MPRKKSKRLNQPERGTRMSAREFRKFEKDMNKKWDDLEAVGAPCMADGNDDFDCPYSYERNPERDIEGMPLIPGDPRSCYVFGHICPKFMEDCGFTPEDLAFRAKFGHYSVEEIADIKNQR